MIKVENLYNYINKIRKSNKADFFAIVNTTLVANPKITKFPEDFLFNSLKGNNIYWSYLANGFKFYMINTVRILIFLQTLIYYKIFYKKPKLNILRNDQTTRELNLII